MRRRLVTTALVAALRPPFREPAYARAVGASRNTPSPFGHSVERRTEPFRRRLPPAPFGVDGHPAHVDRPPIHGLGGGRPHLCAAALVIPLGVAPHGHSVAAVAAARRARRPRAGRTRRRPGLSDPGRDPVKVDSRDGAINACSECCVEWDVSKRIRRPVASNGSEPTDPNLLARRLLQPQQSLRPVSYLYRRRHPRLYQALAKRELRKNVALLDCEVQDDLCLFLVRL